MTDDLEPYEEVTLLVTHDPESVEADPFEDEITNEIVLLDLVKLAGDDIELM